MSPDDVEKIKDSYSRLKNLKLVSKELNIPWQTVYWWLRKEGVEVVGDKSRYGGNSDQIGLLGERAFIRLFPNAEYENNNKYQAKYDFSLNGFNIDVKTSSLRKTKTRAGNFTYRWSFNCYKDDEHPIDFFVCFCLKGSSEEIEKILLLPAELVDTKTGGMSVSSKGSKWDDFIITEDELVDFFDNLN